MLRMRPPQAQQRHSPCAGFHQQDESRCRAPVDYVRLPDEYPSPDLRTFGKGYSEWQDQSKDSIHVKAQSNAAEVLISPLRRIPKDLLSPVRKAEDGPEHDRGGKQETRSPGQEEILESLVNVCRFPGGSTPFTLSASDQAGWDGIWKNSC